MRYPMALSRFLLVMTAGSICLLAAACAQGRAVDMKKAEGLRNLGNAMVRDGNARGGIAKLREAEALDPGNAELQQELAMAYRGAGQYDRAIAHFQRALAIKPGFPEAWNNLGTLYLQLGQWEKAVPCFEKAVADSSYQTPEFAYNNMGLAYYNKGMYEKAVESYRRALKLFPNYGVCLTNMGRAFEAMKDREAATAAYRRAIEVTPEYVPPYVHLAGLYLKGGRDREAAELLKTAIALEPKGPGADEARRMLEEIRHRPEGKQGK